MKVLISNPGIGPHVQEAVKGYLNAGILQYFATTFIDHKDYWLSSFIKIIFPLLEREIGRRKVEGIPIESIKNYPCGEILRTASQRYLSPIITDFIWEKSDKLFDRWASGLVQQQTSFVHTYEFAALETLKRANSIGVPSLYEQPSQHHSFLTPLIKQQIELYPELLTSASQLLYDSKAIQRNLRRDEELATTDFIRCNSTFTKQTLLDAGIPSSKISVIPLGFPKTQPINLELNSLKKVIFLNAGTQNIRKASHLLYIAWRKCNFQPEEAELWLIGRSTLPPSLTQGLPGTVKIMDSIPRHELMALYNKASVFVLPTLADGFGMVISESMSRGVPVITTYNSGGPDIITHGENGWLIPAGDVDALVQQMRWCTENKSNLKAVGAKAQEKAKTWQWEDFGKAVAAFAQNQGKKPLLTEAG